MGNFKKNLKVQVTLIISLFVLLTVFSSCDVPMGLGKPIDFIPPVLTITGYSIGEDASIFSLTSPLYVRKDIKLIGTVKDEGGAGVRRVELRDAVTQKVITKDNQPIYAVITGERWEILLNFDESRNGEKLTVDIVAFDKAGNSGDTSMKSVTIVIDIGPPVIYDPTIKRADTKEAFFEPLLCGKQTCRYCNPLTSVGSFNPNSCLYGLLADERRHDRIANVNRFQNGFFYIYGEITEEETRIKNITLNIYDASEDKIDIPLLKLSRTSDSSDYMPKWLISEADILAEGEKRWSGYTAAYFAGGEYIYRVTVEVTDKSDNPGEISEKSTIEEEGYFLMSQTADIPRGNLDPIVGTTISRGGTIPVEFFDDDILDWAYTGLFTYEQWYGITHIADGVKIEGTNDEEKLAWLENELRAGRTIYNWLFCSERNKTNSTAEPIVELIEGKNIDEKTIYVLTGNSDADYGAFVLFSIVGDKKDKNFQFPPVITADGKTYKSRSKGRCWEIDVVDENAPLIVLDVDKGCPEENTFPTLTAGEYFTINGYTLRENGSGQNGVIKLRMAWIPFGKQGGADSYIQAVQAALSASDYPKNLKDGSITIKILDKGTGVYNDVAYNLEGIQHWDFDFAEFDNNTLSYTYKGGEDEKIGISTFRNQPFERRFSVLGTPDPNVDKDRDYTTAWRDFHYGCTPGSCEPSDGSNPVCRENENKLFVIFAECNMGHQVYRHMRLLSNKTPPSLFVYDITGKILDYKMDELGAHIPNIGDSTFGGIVTPAYDAALRTFNKRDDVYDLLRGVSINVLNQFLLQEYEKAAPFQMYTRGTILKFWINAAPNGDLRVSNIRMKDITFDTVCTCPENEGNPEAQKSCEKCAKQVGSDYNKSDNALTYIEYYPDEAQRVFLFEAEDSLGNIARMQRTVAATNAAKLEKITTQTLDGTYGSRDVIILQADFSGLIKVEGGRPELNIRYPIKNPSTGNIEYLISSLPAYIDTPGDDLAGKETLFLRFRFPVPEGAVPSIRLDGSGNIVQNGGTVTTGYLETMFGWDGTPAGINMGGNTTDPESERTDRPIRLRTSRIIDVTREKHAFIPGYSIDSVGMPNWITKAGSLQNDTDGKKIVLDGIRPVITNVVISGKTSSVNGSYNDFYFRDGETIEVTLTADKPILNSQIPHLPFVVTNLYGDSTTSDSTHLVYSRQGGTANQLVFSLPASNVATDGQITSITIYTNTASGEITDLYNNPIAALPANINNAGGLLHSSLNTNNSRVDRIYIKRLLPVMPVVTLTGGSIPAGVALQSAAATYNHGITMTINPSAASNPYNTWENVIEYTLDGGLEWKTYTIPVTAISNGTHSIRARYKDLAGNEGYQRHRCPSTDPNTGDAVINPNSDICANTRNYSCASPIQINAIFPTLSGIKAVQPPGTYIAGANNRLDFTLSFDADVTVTTAANVTITIADMSETTTNTDGDGTPNTFTRTLTATAATNVRDVTFSWTPLIANTYDMLNGLKISGINLSGLTDRFTNTGPASASITCTVAQIMVSGNPPVDYNLLGIKVSTIAPRVRSMEPQNASALTGNVTASVSADNRTVKITFSKQVQAGRGTITIKPHGNYAIPAVFENEGYYIGTDANGEIIKDANGFEIRHTSAAPLSAGEVGRTYVSGFSDIYNSSLLNSTDRNNLTRGTSMSSLTLDTRTGLSVGPYRQNTHGLKRGAGYTGNYNNNSASHGTGGTATSAPDTTGTDYMVPDTTTKWVLAYNFNNGTNNNFGNDPLLIAATSGVVSGIREVLTKAEFRWQNFEVVNTDRVKFSPDGLTVTITLNEPLLPGLQWRLYYPAGTFTDEAGNPAAAVGDGSYWFWSKGVQKPVIRVDRRSYDARGTGAAPMDASSNDPLAQTYATTGYAGHIIDFDTISYRIETETPGARIFYGTLLGRNMTNSIGSASGEWTGNLSVKGSNTSVTVGANTIAWNGAKANTRTIGQWVWPNLIYRSSNASDGQQTYTAFENGSPVTRYFAQNYAGFRSHNKDAALSADLGFSLGTVIESGDQADFTAGNSFEASKNYVVAEARVDHANASYTSPTYTSLKGYEGIFRTVVMLNQGTLVTQATITTNRRPLLLYGTNVVAGLPTIAGFPVREATYNRDTRYLKLYYRVPNQSRFYWVSTEIVSKLYVQNFGRGDGRRNQNTGETNAWLSGSYGDLSYGFEIDGWSPGTGEQIIPQMPAAVSYNVE